MVTLVFLIRGEKSRRDDTSIAKEIFIHKMNPEGVAHL
jgi:hypothetical protein